MRFLQLRLSVQEAPSPPNMLLVHFLSLAMLSLLSSNKSFLANKMNFTWKSSLIQKSLEIKVREILTYETEALEVRVSLTNDHVSN